MTQPEDLYEKMKKCLSNFTNIYSNSILHGLFIYNPASIAQFLTEEDYINLVSFLLSSCCSLDISTLIHILNKKHVLTGISKAITNDNKLKCWTLMSYCDWDLSVIIGMAKKYPIEWSVLKYQNDLITHLLILIEDDSFFKLPISNVKYNGDYPIHVCSKLKLPSFVKHLANTDSCKLLNDEGYNPIELCIINEDFESFVHLFPFYTSSIIHFICSYGTTQMLEYSLKKGHTLVNNSNGVDCLTLATLNQNQKVAKYIMKIETKRSCC